MEAVSAAFDGFTDRLTSGGLWADDAVPQDRTKELRYTRNADFTDEVADEYLARLMPPEEIAKRLSTRTLSDFVRPYIAA